MPCHLHTIQRSDLQKQESHVSLLFGRCRNFGKSLVNIIFPCLGEAEVSAVNSDLTNFVDAQRVDENIK